MTPDDQNLFFVIVVAGGAGSGIFVYSPSAGAGNLVASIAGSAGTDPYGNAYPAGIMDQTGAGGLQTVIHDAGITMSKNSGVLAPPIITLVDNTVGPPNTTVVRSGSITTPVVIGTTPVTGLAETWHALTPLGTGYAAGTPAPQYRMNALGNVELAGQVVGTTVANLSTIASLPTGYFSAASAFRMAVPLLSGAAAPIVGQNFHVNLTTGGALQLAGLSATGNYTLALDGIVIPLSTG
jgi:hypothetical protein